MSHQETKPIADWAIMVYIAADDILANFAIESLKQLKRAAGSDKATGTNILVVAQVDLDGHAKTRKTRRYIFDGTGDRDSSIENNLWYGDDQGSGEIAGVQPPATLTDVDGSAAKSESIRKRHLPLIPGEMIEPVTLTGFIEFGYKQCNANRHCLVAWGHGPSLFEEADARAARSRNEDSDASTACSRNVESPKLYMNPKELGKAVRDALQGKKLDMIGIDACSMSMLEVAYELKDCADFMIASQQEVPDASFPYEQLVPVFRKYPNEVEEICRIGAKGYKLTYQDYVFTNRTALKKVTISALQTKCIKSVVAPLKELSQALEATRDKAMRKLIFDARTGAKGFVGGLYVDLHDFCARLQEKLDKNNMGADVSRLCKQICEAIDPTQDSTAPVDRFVIANETTDSGHCHGVSIYFPYLGDEEKTQIESIPVKGGTNAPVKSADFLNEIRRGEIEQTEKYHHELGLSTETGLDKFIASWSRILAEEAPDKLDERYSAQQCARNLLALCQKLEKCEGRDKQTPMTQVLAT